MSRALTLTAAILLFSGSLHAQEFGSQVAIDGDQILIAEPTGQQGPSSIYQYEMVGESWEQVGTISVPSGDQGPDFFGRFIGLADGTLAAGGTLFENSTGAVWVFSRENGGWENGAMLRPDSIVEGEAFGRFGHLYEDRLFVSSLGYGGSGAVWLFERGANGEWTEAALIRPESPAEDEFFGWDLEYDGERLIVGSFAGQMGTGAAYVFSENPDGIWSQEARLALQDDESQPGDVGQPGAPGAGAIGVGWFDGMALLGLPGRAGGEGVAYVFQRNEGTGDWVRGLTLSAFDRRPSSFFGHAFHVHDGELWISAPGAGLAGSIYRFDYDRGNGSFGAARKVTNTIGPDLGDGFGGAVATAGDLAVVGQPGDDGGLGSAIVMRNEDGEWVSEQKLLIPGDPGLPAIVAESVECDDEGGAAGFPCSNVDILSFLPLDQIGAGRGIQTNDVWGWTDPDTGREYAIVGRTDGTSFIDVTDPAQPVFLADLPKTPGSQTNSWRDVKVHDSHAFVVADGAGPHGIQIFDLGRLRDIDDAPITVEPDAVYTRIASAHNIVINEETATAYVVGASGGGDSCGGGLHIVDIEDPLQPEFLGCFQDTSTGRAGTGYSHDAMCIIYDGPDTEYVGREICFGSNENALSIADVTDPANPVAVSSATYPNAAYAHQGWITEDHRYFYMGDELDEGQIANDPDAEWEGTRTLIWDVTDLDDPVLAREHFGETFTTDHNLYIRGDLMYQSNYVSGLRILNISDPENPVEVGYLDTVPDDESVTMTGSWSNYPFFESGTIVVSSRREGVFFVRFDPPDLLP